MVIRILDRIFAGKDVSAELLKHFDITKEGKDQVSKTKVRIGQTYYHKMIVAFYEQCHT